jgi:ADP-ribose pyrophosphatase YjhB (NUDIX family)
MSTICKPHIIVATLFGKKNKHLLVEESVGTESVFNQPAGHLEPWKSPKEAAIRETLKETERVVSIDYPIDIYLMSSKSIQDHENGERYPLALPHTDPHYV